MRSEGPTAITAGGLRGNRCALIARINSPPQRRRGAENAKIRREIQSFVLTLRNSTFSASAVVSLGSQAGDPLQTAPSNAPALGVVFDAVLLARCEQQLARAMSTRSRGC